MAVLTLLTDFGYRDHYVAALKARLLRLAPTLPVFDLTHGIEPYNIGHAAHVLRAVLPDFAPGTVHLVAVNDYGYRGAEAIAAPSWFAAEHAGQYLVAADNGLLPLVCDGVPERLVQLAAPLPVGLTSRLPPSLNPTYDVLTPAAVRLALGAALESLGPPATDLYVLLYPQVRVQDDRITGHVMHVDHYGNLVTDISLGAVGAVGRERAMVVQFGREKVHELRPHFAAVMPGEVVCIFNPQGYLCVAINQGNASELLGMESGSQVDVRFVGE